MDNKAKSQDNSWSIALILTQLGAKRAVLSGLDYPELRLLSFDLTLATLNLPFPETLLLPEYING